MSRHDDIRVGSTMPINAVFTLPSTDDLGSSGALWKLVGDDDDNLEVVYTYSSDIALSIQRSGEYQRVSAASRMTVPTTLAVPDSGGHYRIVWELVLASGTHSYVESITIYPFTDAKGSGITLEMQGDQAKLTQILVGGTEANLQVYMDNIMVHEETVPSGIRTATGHEYTTTLDLSDPDKFRSSLDPYLVVWNQPSSTSTTRSTSSMYVYTPSMLSALDELNRYVNFINRDFRLEELGIQYNDLAAYLKGGADKFNGTGHITTFTMTKAKDAIRYWWLICAQWYLLRTYYLAEGMRAFDFSGQSVSLTVDLTQYLESQASNFESQIAQDMLTFKRMLHQRRVTGGDGSGTGPGRIAGRIGISFSPISRIGRNRFGGRVRR